MGLGAVLRKPALLLLAAPPLVAKMLAGSTTMPLVERLTGDRQFTELLGELARGGSTAPIQALCEMTMAAAAASSQTDVAYVAIAALDYVVAPLACACAIWMAYRTLDGSAPARGTALVSRLPAVLAAKLLLDPPFFLLALASWRPPASSVGAAGSTAVTCEQVTLVAEVLRDNFVVVGLVGVAIGYLALRFTFLYQAVVVDGVGPVAAFRRSWQVSAWRSLPIFVVRILLVGGAARIAGLLLGGNHAFAAAIVSPLDAAIMTAAYLQLRGASPEPGRAPIGSLATAS